MKKKQTAILLSALLASALLPPGLRRLKLVKLEKEREKERAGAETVDRETSALFRRAAAEGAVLLKNTGILPLARGTTVSVFSRMQKDWYPIGYGSGGEVNKIYTVPLIDGLRSCEALRVNEKLAAVYEKWIKAHPSRDCSWGRWRFSLPDMPLTDGLVKAAAEKSDCALYVIGRSAGEGRDCEAGPGSYYLTETEKNNLALIMKYFDSVILLLNISNVMDLSWLPEYGDKIGAALLLWQGGMESGNAAADLLCGAVSPSGKLADTFARRYEDYPSSSCFGGRAFNDYQEDVYVGYRAFETFNRDTVLYPFGYGLSYTAFELNFDGARKRKDGISLRCTVKNTGERSGREVVQVYVRKPCGALGNPARVLAAFEKTGELEPGESEALQIFIPNEALWSYDDSGKSGFPHAYILEKGEFSLYLGTDVRSAVKVWSFTQKEISCTQQLRQVCAPRFPFERFVNADGRRQKETVPTAEYDLRQIILNGLPQDVIPTKDRGYDLRDVRDGKITLEEFTAQLSLRELEALTRGDYVMGSPLGAKGNAGVIGGVLKSLRKKGVPPLTTTDGPSGIRLSAACSLAPAATLLACSFDPGLVRAVYAAIGREMKRRGSDILLAPAMNIHRNPLCGRNFEYYSEDPLLTGTMAAAAVTGIQSEGGSACVKHFACNNQEFNRTHNDSRLSERALREIYLKGFEICMKTAKPDCVMSSYNQINGVWGHYNYELCERVLRGEWGYEGLVMTDWWMRYAKSPEFPKLRDNGYRVRAGVDVMMPGGRYDGDRLPDGTLFGTYGEEEGIRIGEAQRSAMRVLRLCLQKLPER